METTKQSNWIRQAVVNLFFISGLLSILTITTVANAVTTIDKESSSSIGIVNLQQILQQSSRVKALRQQLDAKFKNRREQVTEDQRKLQNSIEQFKKESPTMSDKDREAAQSKITANRTSTLQTILTLQRDMEHDQENALKTVMQDLMEVVTKLAKEKKYNLILDAQAVIYSSDKTADLTKKVATQFDLK